MKIVVTGSSGLIGSALVTRLLHGGHQVVKLVRRPPASADEVTWEPATGRLDAADLAGVQAAVHLAGAGVGDHRWTEDYKRTIRDSRVLGTRTLVTALLQLSPQPTVLVSGSAVGFYGDRGDEELTESSSGGTGFLADVVRAWESETVPAQENGMRVALARTGLVMSPQGGAFAKLLTFLRLGLGGPIGAGKQWWPWITLDDEVRAIEHLLTHEITGPVNLAGPGPARNAQVMRALGAAFHRPSILPVPRFALQAALGEFADDVVASQRMLPQRLLDTGFTFTHPTIADAAAWVAAG